MEVHHVGRPATFGHEEGRTRCRCKGPGRSDRVARRGSVTAVECIDHLGGCTNGQGLGACQERRTRDGRQLAVHGVNRVSRDVIRTEVDHVHKVAAPVCGDRVRFTRSYDRADKRRRPAAAVDPVAGDVIRIRPRPRTGNSLSGQLSQWQAQRLVPRWFPWKTAFHWHG